MYRQKENQENLNRRVFEGVGKYDIPEIKPLGITEIDCNFIGFNYASTCKDRAGKGIHFFLDDYQFLRLWNNFSKYEGMLKQFKYLLTPDFSMYADDPVALQIYNHYRKHWIGAYMQELGMQVIPTICWSTPDSYDWCFDGEPVGGAVAVSSVGCLKQPEAKENFLSGYDAMMKRLKPSLIIFHGLVPEGCTGNIYRISAYQEKHRAGGMNVSKYSNSV